MSKVVIVAANRTPIGKFNGLLSDIPAAQLSAELIKSIIKKHQIDPQIISEVILGQTLQAGCGQNSARQATINGGLPVNVPAVTINKVCGSGLKAIATAAMTIAFNRQFHNEESIIIAGGHESMSRSPHIAYLRNGQKMGDIAVADSMLRDGLTDAFSAKHMGITAENLARIYNISRQEQDEFALNSQQKAAESTNRGIFSNEIVPLQVTKNRKEKLLLDRDESIQHEASLEKLNRLRPAFLPDGSVTAGNASSINDGAAALLLMSEDAAKQHNLPIIAKIASFASHAVEPDVMGIGPVGASKAALQRAGWSVSDLDLIEANEAFAVQAIAVNREMGWNTNRININGGAIALGHPIGASGARIVVTLIHSLVRRGGGRGLATLCVGGGMGLALCLEV